MIIGRAWFNTAFQYLLDHSGPFPYSPVRQFFHDLLPRLDHTFSSNTKQFEQVDLNDIVQANTPYSEGLLTAIATSFIACSIVALFFFALFVYYGTLGRKKWDREEYLQMVDLQKGYRKAWGRRTCHMMISFCIIIVSAAAMVISNQLTKELDNANANMTKFATHMKLTSVDIDMMYYYTDQVADAVQGVIDDTPSNSYQQFNTTLSELFEAISYYTEEINHTFEINPIGQVDNVLLESLAFQDEDNSNFQKMLYSLSDISYMSYAVLMGLLFSNLFTLCHTRFCATCRRATSVLDVLVFAAVGLLSALTLGGSMLLSDFCEHPGSHWISLINNAGPHAIGPKLQYAYEIDSSSPLTSLAQYNAQRKSTATTLAYYGICAAAKGSGEFVPSSYRHRYATWTWGIPVSGLDDLYAINAKIKYNMHPMDLSPKTNTGTYAAAEVMTAASQLYANSITLHNSVLSNYTLTWAEPSTLALMQQSNLLYSYANDISNNLSLGTVCPIVNGSLHSLCGEGLGFTSLLWSLSIVSLVLFVGLLVASARLCSFHPGDTSIARAVVPLTLLPGEKMEETSRASALIVAMGLTPRHKRKKQKIKANVVLETGSLSPQNGENDASWK